MSWACACGINNKDEATKCGGCGWTLEQLNEYLKQQQKKVSADSVISKTPKKQNNTVFFGIMGFLLGCLIGFLLRPSVFLVGQLPFIHVLTRGTALSGMDTMLIPAAQTSFNYMFLGGILGGLLGGFIGKAYASKGTPIVDNQMKKEPLIEVTKKFCGYCGETLQEVSIFCSKCGQKV